MPEYGESLSQREIDVLKCVADGSTNKEVASVLSISPYTVKTHLKNIYTKLGTSSRTEAIRVGMEQGVLLIPGQSESEPVVVARPESVVETAVLPQTDETTPPSSSTTRWRLWLLLGVLLLGVMVATAWVSGWVSLAPSEELQTFTVKEISPTWRVADVPLEPAAFVASSSVGLVSYRIGGMDTSGVLNEVWAVDTLEKTTTAVTSKPTAVSHAAAATLGGEIYVVGGIDESGEATAIVEVFSPSANAWRLIAPLPQPLSGAFAVADLNALYLFGGHNGETAVDNAYRYDPLRNEWEALSAMSSPRAYAAGGLIDGEIYVVGGENATGVLAQCDKLSLATINWSSCPSMEMARSHAKGVVTIGKLFLFGGAGGASLGEIYSPDSQSWELIEAPEPLQTLSQWEGAGVTLAEREIYIIGGMMNGRVTDQTYIYTPFSNRIYLPSASTEE